MKKLLGPLTVLWMLVGWCFGQARPAITNQQQIYALPTSAFGYPPILIPGSTRTIPVLTWCANVSVTGYTASPSGTLMSSTNHGLSVGDLGYPMGFFNGPMPFKVGQPWTVTAVTTNTFTINATDGDTTPYTETQATFYKTTGTSCTGKVKWEINDLGGTAETYKLQSLDATQDTGFVSHPVINSTTGVIRLVVGPTAGVASSTGSITTNNFTLHSTVEFNLKATSVDDPTKSATMHMIVADNGAGYSGIAGKAFASPSFRIIYKNRYVPVVAQVRGNVNQMVNWTIESAPIGGDASLLYSTYPQAVFNSGTVAGLYRLKACPAVDGSALACAHISMWVDSAAPPAANTDKVEQTPCPTNTSATIMGITWGSVFDIGKSGSGTPDLLSIPQNPVGPVLVRLWNNDSVGGNPTAYHNQLQVNKPSGGPFSDTHPAFVMCGVVNATTGELPVIDGDHATVNSWASQYVVGPYADVAFIDTTSDVYPTTISQPFNTITLQNIHIRNITGGYQFFYVADGTLQNWGESTGTKPVNAIDGFNLIGNYYERVANGVFDDCNSQNNGWSHCVINSYDEGNHFVDYGYPGTSTAHPLYKQALGNWSMLDLMDGATNNSEGTAFYSDRGSRSWHMYSRMYTTSPIKQGSVIGAHSEGQDDYNIFNADEWWGLQGNTNCGTYFSIGPGCQALADGSTALNWFNLYAAFVEEHNRTDYFIGNAFSVPNVYKSLGCEMTHSFYSYQPYSVGGWNREWFPENLTQNCTYSYNTIQFSSATSVQSGQELLMEDTRLRIQDVGETVSYLMQPQYYPETWWANNLIPLAKQTFCDYACNVLNVNAHQISHYQTNMFGGIVTPAGSFNSHPTAFSTNGWWLTPNFSDWGNIDPIVGSGGHVSGWDLFNFLTYSTYPIQSPSLVPLNTSPAVGAATALQGDAAYYPPRFNAVDPLMLPFTLRTDLTTVGAYDPNGGPTLVSITVTPNPLSVVVGSSNQLTATCLYSDSSTTNCTGSVTWSNGGSSHFHMDAIAGQVDGDSIGSGTATATLSAIPGSATVNVVAAPPHYSIDGAFKLGGNSKVIAH